MSIFSQVQLIKYIPLQLTFFLILGILSGFYLNPSPQIVVITLVALLALLGLFYFIAAKSFKISPYYIVITYSVFFFIGVASITFQNDLNKKQHYTNSVSEQLPVKVILKINTILKSNVYYDKYEAEVLQVNENNTQGKILVNIKKDSLQNQLNIDDKLITYTNFQSVNKPKNPYQFDYKNYLEKRNVYKQITISNNDILLLNTEKTSLKGLAYKFRLKVNESLMKNGFTGDELAIINALILGQRQEISKDLIENYSKAGAIHILAVSGLHVGIILLLINFLLKPLERFKNGNNLKLIITILLLWTFAFIAGMSASVVRAVTMFTALSIGLAFDRKNSVYKNLIISVFFLLLFNPYYLFEVGFQLSYLAVFFIVWVQPMLYNIWKPKFKLADKFWQLFTLSVAAQLGVLPLSLYYFHQFPGLFFVANLAIIPVLGLILGVGIAAIFLSLIGFLHEFIATFYQGVIALMNQLIAWVAKQESFLFQDISFSLLLMIATYLLLIFSFRWIENKTPKKLKYALFAVILFQSVFLYEKHNRASNNEFIVFNKSRSSILAENVNNKLTIYSSENLENNNILKSYQTSLNINSLTSIDSVKNIYQLKNKKMLVVDSLGIHDLNSLKPDYVLLCQSPKINLERLINKLNPKIIIADASNYKSYVERWQTTCLMHNIKFYYTVKEGAFIEKL